MAHRKKLKKYQIEGQTEEELYLQAQNDTISEYKTLADFKFEELERGAGNIVSPFSGVKPTELSPDEDVNYAINQDLIRQGKIPGRWSENPEIQYNTSPPYIPGGINPWEDIDPAGPGGGGIRREGGQVLNSFKSAARFDQKSYKKNPGRRNKG